MKYIPLIYTALEKYAQNTLRRFHMPGHGGAIKDGFLSAVSAYDVTELNETDNLSCPEGVIKEAENLASQKFGSGATLFSCGGATLCLQAAIFTALKRRPQARVFCHRRVHKSVLNAFYLMGVQPKWITDYEGDFSDCDILVFTYTDYYGNIVPYERICEISRKYGIITVADNSHGAHLAFMNKGMLHPVKQDIDFSVDSLHKTLPVLTGGACLNIKDRDDYDTCRYAMTVFGSTSPSYLIMASVDRALSEVDECIFENTAQVIRGIEKRLGRYFIHDSDSLHRDPLRIVLRCENPGELYNLLYKKGIKCEFYDACGVVLIPPYGADEQYFEPLVKALEEYDGGIYFPTQRIKYKIPAVKLSIREALTAPGREITLEEANGKISAREYSLYPPGIPVIVPGEVFDDDIISCLKNSLNKVQILTERKEKTL